MCLWLINDRKCFINICKENWTCRPIASFILQIVYVYSIDFDVAYLANLLTTCLWL